MQRDFIKELGYKALDNRFKRISDRMSHDTRRFFKRLDLDIEPSWHLVFKLLKENQPMTMVDIAGQLGYTHPSMVVLLQKMKTRGYVNSEKDSLDSRKQNLSLTQKAMDLLPELEQIWTCCEQAIYSMLEGDFSITEQLDKIEESLDSVSIDQRFYNEFQKHKKS